MSSIVSDRLRSSSISVPNPSVRHGATVVPLVEEQCAERLAGSGFARAAMIGLAFWFITAAVAWSWFG